MHQAAAVEAGADASCLRCASIPSIHLSVVATVTVIKESIYQVIGIISSVSPEIDLHRARG